MWCVGRDGLCEGGGGRRFVCCADAHVRVSQIVDKTIMEADLDRDGKISFEEFTKMVENTDVSMSMTLGKFLELTVVSILRLRLFHGNVRG